MEYSVLKQYKAESSGANPMGLRKKLGSFLVIMLFLAFSLCSAYADEAPIQIEISSHVPWASKHGAFILYLTVKNTSSRYLEIKYIICDSLFPYIFDNFNIRYAGVGGCGVGRPGQHFKLTPGESGKDTLAFSISEKAPAGPITFKLGLDPSKMEITGLDVPLATPVWSNALTIEVQEGVKEEQSAPPNDFKIESIKLEPAAQQPQDRQIKN